MSMMIKTAELKARLQKQFPLGEPEIEDAMFALAKDLHYRDLKKIEDTYLRMLELHLDGKNWIYSVFTVKPRFTSKEEA